MKRRSFLATSVAVAVCSLSRSVVAQSNTRPPRGAVVIGVDRPHNLPPLSAAASGAKKVADWLKNSEGFEVKLLADFEKPVLASEIYAAVDDFVMRGTLEQLIVYFSGHGFLLGRAEYWLLSQAPDNPNEAINLDGSVELARDCGIPNVAFISDACRSTSDSLRAQSVHGYQIFPTPGNVREPRAEVDRFATLPGDPALEVPVAKSTAGYEAIYTACFLDAFEHPEADLVVQLADGSRVVPIESLNPISCVRCASGSKRTRSPCVRTRMPY